MPHWIPLYALDREDRGGGRNRQDSFCGDIFKAYGKGFESYITVAVLVRSNIGQMRRLSPTPRIRGG
jgi:hypothetical protein